MKNNTTYFIYNKEGGRISIDVKFDKRLRKTLRYEHRIDGSVLLRVPNRTTKKMIQNSIKQIEQNIQKQPKKRKGRTDKDLQERAEYLNKRYLKNIIQWDSIRWVNNMKYRLGSCTTGGPTDGHIRISAIIKTYPQYVIDYILIHELAHRKFPNHSKDFWAFVKTAYSNTDKAIGFIEGVGFVRGQPFE